MKTNLYLHQLGRGKYTPDILRKIGYKNIVKVDGINHLVLSREFIEAFIEASSEYGELTDELNNFIDRLNRVKSAEIGNLTEVQIDSMLYLEPRIADDAGLEEKRIGLREFTVDMHFKSTNVFWIEENEDLGRHVNGEDVKSIICAEAIKYKRMDNLPSWLSEENANLKLHPPSNFDPRLHTDPAFKPFVWIPTGTWAFINENGQWKLAIFMSGR